MHFHRLASMTIGAWLAGSLFTTVFTTRNLRSVDELLQAPTPEAAKLVAKLGAPEARLLLRHEASEVNRRFLRNWEWAQLGLGALLLLGLFFGADGKRYTTILCLLMLLMVVFLHWFLARQMADLGSGIDFVPADQQSVTRDHFQSLQTGYTILDAVKLAFGFLLAGGLLKRRRWRSAGIE